MVEVNEPREHPTVQDTARRNSFSETVKSGLYYAEGVVESALGTAKDYAAELYHNITDPAYQDTFHFDENERNTDKRVGNVQRIEVEKTYLTSPQESEDLQVNEQENEVE